MQSLSDDERKQALGEVLADELKAIHELVKDVPEMKQKIDVLDSDMKEVKSYIKVIKAAVTDISREQKEHDRRKTHNHLITA
jgi:hypothetical protein